jgi:hypothetical protein
MRRSCACVGAVLMVCGCAGRAEVLERDLHGGELCLRGAVVASTAEARLLMAEHGTGSYRLQEQGVLLAPNALSRGERIRYVCEHAPLIAPDHAALLTSLTAH